MKKKKTPPLKSLFGRKGSTKIDKKFSAHPFTIKKKRKKL